MSIPIFLLKSSIFMGYIISLLTFTISILYFYLDNNEKDNH